MHYAEFAEDEVRIYETGISDRIRLMFPVDA